MDGDQKNPSPLSPHFANNGSQPPEKSPVDQQPPGGNSAPDAQGSKGWSNLWTVQNVVTGTNVIIIAFTVLFISLISYFLSTASTSSAIQTISINSAAKVHLALLSLFTTADLLNSYITGVFQINPVGLNNTNEVAHQLVYIMLVQPPQFDAVYLAQVDASNASDQILVFAGRTQVGKPVDSVAFSGNFTDFVFNQFPLNSSCPVINFSCPIANTTQAILSVPLNVTTRPYYILANTVGGEIWTDVYLFDNDVEGITNSIPVLQTAPNGQNVTVFLSSVDISLDSLSTFLQNISFGISSNPDVRIYTVNGRISTTLPPGCPTSGLLTATNLPGLSPVIPETGCQRQAVNSSDPIIDMTSNEVISRFGNFPNISPGSVASGAVFTAGGFVIVLESLDFGPPPANISWFIVVAFPESVFLSQINTLYRIIIPIIAPLIVVLGVLASILLTRYITRPLKRLTKQLLTVANLDFDKIGPTKPPDRLQLKEIARINAAVFTMMSGLKSFAKYVPQDVVKLLLKMRKEAVLGVEEIELTVYFSDIADFTSISEDLDPESLVNLMSEYLQEMSTIILEHQGIVDKYIGDAVMAFWNAPLPIENHSMVGCEVALLTQSRLRVLQEKWTKQNYPIVRVRVGVNSGLALVGNLGSPERLSYTCIGDNVTLASRLEGLNKLYGTYILISDAVYQNVKDAYVARLLETIKTKRMDGSTRIYELICEKNEETSPDILSRVELYEKAMQHYYEKEFEAAKNAFRSYLQLVPEDLGAIRHISSCDALIANPPPEQWDAAIKLPDY
jgi:adenylate cyclase